MKQLFLIWMEGSKDCTLLHGFKENMDIALDARVEQKGHKFSHIIDYYDTLTPDFGIWFSLLNSTIEFYKDLSNKESFDFDDLDIDNFELIHIKEL